MNIAIVGAGDGGTAVLRSLSRIEAIHISKIIDKNLQAPGILLARELGIKTSNDLNSIDANSTTMIIEATGVDEVSQLLYDKYKGLCKIIDSEGAYLIMMLVERDIETLEKLNQQMEIINNTSMVVQDQIEEISKSVNDVHSVSKMLNDTTETSAQYIKESDNIIRYVNKIAKQIKILGINATIEAARAGEYGKGFTVVANQIQKLANDSEGFAKEINDILEKLSTEIGNVNIESENLKKLSTLQIGASDKVKDAVKELKNQTNKDGKTS